MNNFLDGPNPDTKIGNIINAAIKNKENKIKQMKDDIYSLNKQREEGIYYTNIANIDSVSAQYLGMAIITIISDILTGFVDAVDKLRTNAKIHIQKGGSENDGIQLGDTTQSSLDDTTKSFHDTVQKSKDKFTDISKKIHTGELGAISIGKSIGSDILSKLKDMGEASIKTGIMWSEDYINTLIDMGMEFTGESEMLKTPIDELSPELNKKILLLAGVLNEISDNPATREAVKEIAEAIAITAVEILEEIRPELNKITDQSLEMLQEVGDKSVRGATATGIALSKAAISEIPFVGGVINLMLALGKGFNVVMETYDVIVEKGGPIVVDTAKMGVGVGDTVEKGKERIIKALPVPHAEPIVKAAPIISKGGGGQNSCNKTNNVINKCGKRLRKTMKSFSSTLPKLTFPLSSSSSYNKVKSGKKSRKRK